MTHRLTRTFRLLTLRYLHRLTVSGGLLALGATLFVLDHRWTNLTWGALALTAGAYLTRKP